MSLEEDRLAIIAKYNEEMIYDHVFEKKDFFEDIDKKIDINKSFETAIPIDLLEENFNEIIREKWILYLKD